VDAIQRQLDLILREGYSPSQIIAQLLSSVLSAGGGSLSEVQRGKLLVQLSEVDRRITEVRRAAAAYTRASDCVSFYCGAGQRRLRAAAALLYLRQRLLARASGDRIDASAFKRMCKSTWLLLPYSKAAAAGFTTDI
jgi:hypothetical protein